MRYRVHYRYYSAKLKKWIYRTAPISASNKREVATKLIKQKYPKRIIVGSIY